MKFSTWPSQYDDHDSTADRMASTLPMTDAQTGNASTLPTAPNAQASEADRSRRFWLGMLYAALVGYGGGSAAMLSYVALTWSQSNRGWMVAVVGFGLVFAFGVFLRRHQLVSARYRVWLFGSWNAATFVWIVLLCVLDSGINSPMTYLYVLPMLYLAIGFPTPVVLVSGAVGLTGCALLIGLNTGPVYGPTNMLQLMMLSISLLLAMIGASNRGRQDQELAQMREHLENLASIDELTGCLNQRAFKVTLSQEIQRAQRYDHALALLLIDIDHFKEINDRHGHLMGDSVLRDLGALLRHNARETDQAGRPGGDELALIVPETDLDDACLLAERVRTQIKLYPPGVDVTLSIGISAIVSGNKDTLNTLFRSADRALYRAKQHGRDQVAVWHPSNPD